LRLKDKRDRESLKYPKKKRRSIMERRELFKLGLAGMAVLAGADSASALKYYPRPSDKKWAVLYGTWCGTARDAGVWISEGMGGIADVFDIRENMDLKGFDHIVIGSAIRMGKVHPQLEQYIGKNKEWLAAKIQGLYAVCGNMGNPVGQKQIEQFIDNHLAQLLGVSGISARVFNGRITKILMEEETRKMMEKMAPEDYDKLKRSECMEFGKKILAQTQKAK
jgi:menaquinone-dependent protoporphyrinogen IX oxidase